MPRPLLKKASCPRRVHFQPSSCCSLNTMPEALRLFISDTIAAYRGYGGRQELILYRSDASLLLCYVDHQAQNCCKRVVEAGHQAETLYGIGYRFKEVLAPPNAR
jgi:hypothetical protein